MKKKGVELLSIFFISMLVFCSFAISAYADTNEWGYNDSYVNYNSSEDKQLVFFPLAPITNYSNYMIVYWNDNYYFLATNANQIEIYGNNFIYNPLPDYLDLFVYTESSNNWELIDKSLLLDNIGNRIMIRFHGTMTVVDTTCMVMKWAAGDPWEPKSIVNYTGYRIYWNLALIFNQILIWVDNLANTIMSIVLLRYLCLTALAGEILLFCVILIRRVGELKNEKINC